MKTKKVKLADVLWEAANERLWEGVRYDYGVSGKWRFSCDAVNTSLSWNLKQATRSFLRDLGCDIESIHMFEEHREGTRRQGVRYMWLLLAMHVAEDENVEIEVEA
jgi:hypothetical protein